MTDGTSPAIATDDDGDVSGYYQTRLAPNPHRTAVWKHICRWLQRWIPADSAVLELGAGWCDFANTVTARRSVAMDVDATVRFAAAPHVQAEHGDCTDLSRFDDDEFDVVFASNLLEHLERPAAGQLVAEAARVLRPGGRLILLQPNFRLNPGKYFDDYTHVAIYTDRSLADYLASEGWRVVKNYPRFLPMTMKSRASALTFLVPWYLRSPIKPLAGQMLLVATPTERVESADPATSYGRPVGIPARRALQLPDRNRARNRTASSTNPIMGPPRQM